MASRFVQRNSRPSLFSSYEASRDGSKSESPYRFENGLNNSASARFSPNNASGSSFEERNKDGDWTLAGSSRHFRAATPNKRGQYSDAVLSELESQNDDQLEGMSAKVRMLKDITSAIGVEIRDSTALAETMNSSFDNTRIKLRVTMDRMLRMAERTGIGWKVWLGFLVIVSFLFWYVWVFI